jgi:prephenate dehydrogenase
MAVQITLIGLGQIGASVGLALANQKDLILRVGHDKESTVAHQAKQIGAVDRIERNLHTSVDGADLVLLTLPMDQIRETLEFIAPDLKEGAVIMDTAPVKEVVADWIKELLPPERHYIGLTPVLNPAYLHEIDAGIGAAHADLFQHGLIAIVSPPNTRSDAIKLAADLTRLLGATPLFADTAEMDGLMASTHLLPQLLSAALLNVTVDQPGWREGRKVAGKAYAEVSSGMVQPTSPASLASTALYNQENSLRMIDSAIAALQAMRSDLKNRDEKSLVERLERAFSGRELWWRQRQVSDWTGEELAGGVDAPKASEVFGKLLGFRPKPKK